MRSSELMNVNTVPDVDTAIEQWHVYQRLCGKEGILDENDFQKILVKEKNNDGKYELVIREFKKKSAWQKLGRAFNVTTRIVCHEFIRTKTGRINEAYYCVCATLPNGRSVESDALCSRSEKGKSKVSDHTIMSTAKTRATNRAISELIGAGEVSSDEMTAEYSAPKNSGDEMPVKTVDESTNDDLKNIVRSIKSQLESADIEVTKSSMRSYVVKNINSGNIESKLRPELIQYINQHCPEELE